MVVEHSVTEVVLFCVLIIVCLWCDLHAHQADKPVSARNAAIWSCIWVGLALVFAGYIGYSFGSEQVQLFLTGYLLEKSLSVDNLFVIMAIFSSFAVKDAFQHRVLYYGVLGALVLRLIFVAAGSSLVAMFGPYALASFGIFVLWTAWKMWQSMHSGEKEEIVDYSEHWAVRYTKRFIPVHNQLSGHDFFVKAPDTTGKLIWKATPLFLCLFVVEVSDVMFAFDSVPAIIAVTHDPFLVYTSNVFAILGLRSMYFLLAAGKRAGNLTTALLQAGKMRVDALQAGVILHTWNLRW